MSLRLGWIGCGTHATQMLLSQWLRHNVVLSALCDNDETRLQSAARQFGVARTYVDAQEMICSGGIDAIGMAVGPHQHHQFCLAALKQGLPVFMEKPPACNLAMAQELLTASEKSRQPVLVGFMKRYSIGNRMAHTIIQSGDFGKVLGLSGFYMTAPGYFEGSVDYSDFFLHHCVHYMDLASHLVSPVTNIDARKVESAPGRLLFHVHLDFESGAIGTIAMGTLQSRGAPVERIEIMSDHQRLEIDNVINLQWHRNPAFKVGDPTARLIESQDTLVWRPNFTAAANEDVKGYHDLLGDVVPALMGKESSAPTIRDGVVAMERLEQLRRVLKL
jgi:myo-inositol 2-dehydrogenase/D-chiro-inositol 1-dehydrogenase